MKLEKVRIRKFRSIEDITFKPNQKITVFVGANESGKSNILKALTKITNDKDSDFNEEDLTRNYDSERKQPKITYKFSLSVNDRKYLKSQSSNFLKNLSVQEKSIFEKILDNINSVQIDVSCDKNLSKTYSFHFNKAYENEINLEESSINKLKNDILRLIGPIKILHDKSFIPFKKSVKLDELKRNPSNFTSYYELLKIKNISIDELIAEGNGHTSQSLLIDLGEKINEEFPKFWKQDSSIQFHFAIDPKKNLNIHIKDNTAKREYPDSRSDGFQWFFTFVIKYLALKRNKDIENAIFLFDELGLHLHPKAQRDLSIILDDFSQKNQIIFTTHFPYLLNQNYPERILVVNKEPFNVSKNKGGTLINSKPYSEMWKSLRNSIGLMLGDSFSVAENTLVVEGPSEIFALRGLNNLLKKYNKDYFLEEEITIFPGIGTGSGMLNSINFCNALNLKIAALVDGDQAGEKLINKVTKKEIMLENNILSLKDYCDTIDEEVTIENLIPLDIYLESLNIHYTEIKKEEWKNVTIDDIKNGEKKLINRIINHVEIKNKLGKGNFDKVGVMRQVSLMLDLYDSEILKAPKYKTQFDKIINLIKDIKRIFINEVN